MSAAALPRIEFLLIGLAGLAAVVLLTNKGAATALGSAAVDAVDGVIGGAVIAVGEKIGIPATDADKARELMDAYGAASWDRQLVMAFQISAYAKTSDYLRWTVDKSFRPAPGSY